ncbi:hypothetical protein Tco_0042764, partial [Tanacetum coccineum]
MQDVTANWNLLMESFGYATYVVQGHLQYLHPAAFVQLQDRWKLLCSICGVPYGACIQ